MSKINAKGLLTGATGPVYFRILNGKPIVQSKPGKGRVKQAQTTKTTASIFGKISKESKKIRLALLPILQDFSDSQMHGRFTSRLLGTVMSNHEVPKENRTLVNGDLSLLEYFQFNIKTPFNKFCAVSPMIELDTESKLHISLPEFTISQAIMAPKGATHADICYFVTALDGTSEITSSAELFRISVQLKDESVAAKEFITTTLTSGHLVFVAAAVFFSREDRLAGMVSMNSKLLHPCELVRVVRI